MRKIKDDNGVVTLEACIVVPVFVLLMLLVNGLFVMFMGQQIVTHVAIQSAKSLALDPYSVQRVAADKQDHLADMFVDLFTIGNGEFVSTDQWYMTDVENTVQERFFAYLDGSGDADKILEVIGIEGGSTGLDFSESTVQDGVLTLKIKYKQNFVYGTSDLTSIEREITLVVKLFEYKQLP